MAPPRTVKIHFQDYTETLPFLTEVPADETVEVEDRVLSFCDVSGMLHLFNWDLIYYVTESHHYPPEEAANETR